MSNTETKPLEINTTPENSAPSTVADTMKDYHDLKNNLLIGTVVITLISFVLIWYFYSLNTSLNYLLGACVSLIYVNSLAREVQQVGISKGRVGSTRLAMFLGLMIITLKWEQLQILPVFLGFMTYKASILFYILPLSLLQTQKN